MTFADFESRFEKVRRTGSGFVARCPGHEDKQASLSVSAGADGRILLKCHAGCAVPDICSAMQITLSDLFAAPNPKNTMPITVNRKPVAPLQRPASTTAAERETERASEHPGEKPVIEAIYSYTDALGTELYQAVRMKPKSFRQRHMVHGEWIWKMDGVERVLYRLPEVLAAETVWIVEGEKDVDNLRALGLVATCNVGGAGKWLDGYTDSLAGKDIVLCGDNDKPGKEHVTLVFDSIAGKAKSVRIVNLPAGIKDVSDFIAAQATPTEAQKALETFATAAVPHLHGIRMPVYSMADLEAGYVEQTRNHATQCLDLGIWLPALRHKIRPLVPGELVLLLGDTGAGKTAILQNIALNAGKLKVLFFEMELPPELLYERFLAARMKLKCDVIEKDYIAGKDLAGRKGLDHFFPNLYVCTEPRLTLEGLERLVTQSELKIGSKPGLVLVDYVQLLAGIGNRYEKTSNIAEGLKVLAKATRTIIVVASQVARRTDEDPDINLHSGKDSGSLENSAGLVLGAWRDRDRRGILHLKVLKATKGGSGTEVLCDFDGERMLITESNSRAPVHK